ncbi:MAG: hypothetical protein ACRYG8_43975 [Janthinobacterium lividum]
MLYQVGDAVRWISSGLRKEGVVIAVIAPRQRVSPALLTGTGGTRDHETYVVKGGAPGKRTSNYWPQVSLLHRAEGLTAAEVAWCHANAPRVRELMPT